MTEAEFIAALRILPLHPGAAGLCDDAATLSPTDGTLVLSTDTMVEGVHFPADMRPADVAWRLVACALSDLAAKGAEPVGVMLNYPLRSQDNWDHAFLDGLAQVLAHYAAPLLGGDTVSIPPHAPRVLTLTAIGRATHTPVPVRSGAKAGDLLYVTGTIGAALLGFERLEIEPNAYRRPVTRIADGMLIAPHASAMMDVSDGLLLDAQRMAAASKLSVSIALDAVPIPPELAADRLRAVTWGDDYQLLFAAPPTLTLPVAATAIGRFAPGSGLTLVDGADPLPLPQRLGFEHTG